MNKAIQDRYNHLVLMYGENSDYMNGFRECLRLVEQTEKEPTWKKKMLNTFLGGGRE